MASTSLRFQLQYYFNDDNSHSMDAFVRNENEKELLLIFREVINALDLHIQIESEALAEGSLKNLWKFIGENDKQLKLVGGVLLFLMVTIPLGMLQFKNMSLDNDNKILDNEIKREELRKIRNEAISEDSILTQDIIDKVVKELDGDLKIQVHKSNFYKRTDTKNEIVRISTVQIDEKSKPVGEEKIVYKDDFSKFVLRSNDLEPIIDEEAIIEIVSPVLKSGDFVWKGIYNGEIVSFHMLDPKFKNSVLNKEFSFVNGDSIKCVYQQKRKLDEVGMIKIVERNVIVVLEKLGKTEPTKVTKQGEQYLRTKKYYGPQLGIFNIDETE